MKEDESGEKKATRQCWECLKRRLVCDHTLPHCKKCIKASKKCPGYDNQKPLQWVEPGKVTSRRRKKDSPPKVYTIRPRNSQPVASTIPSLPVACSEDSNKSDSPETITLDDGPTLEWPIVEELRITPEAIELYKNQLASLLVQEDKAAWWYSLTAEEQTGHIALMAAEAAAGSGVGERMMRIGSQRKVKAVVERGQYWEAAMLLQSDRDPLEKLKRLLWIMETNQLPSYEHLSNETCEVVQAVNYFNTRIYPDVKETDSLAPNPAVIHFPVWALHVLPPAMHHTLICLGLNHFVHSLPAGSNRAVIAGNRSKIYKYRGLAIRALSENVARDKTRSSDLTISSILMFMAMEVQNSSSGDWRSHVHGMKQLIDMRGGFGPLLRTAPYLISALVIFVVIVTFSNSLGPAVDQTSITEPLEQHIKEVERVYNLIFPYILCPPTLFIEIIRINRLRQDVMTSPFEDPNQHILDAHDILARIEAFVPEDWAQPGEHHNDWQLIGSIYQSAIALYCTMSLQAVAVLPNSLEMVTMRTIHGERLLENLKLSAQTRYLKKFSLFPLCVLGVEAGYHDQQSTRLWIERRLEDHSRLLGTSSPLKARAVLRRYWQQKKAGWDECFDSPYVFIL
ncbi:hypothetical protein BU25DRAFT_202235 [Macroventuria anomochaeta]|uniref:Uncharacterized protein n=1 Tax=Macroventuria anomochaeta TaxID=301207 RepID=A0ACB6RLP4_9PLEO|nr:uncharacterized protein BU25DRAFT_202235 [Macroventuria anomochaeta]KAF2622860.1 hypothetical protein BU25DRAFT_202235 [Macroventuria anomochaeta]